MARLLVPLVLLLGGIGVSVYIDAPAPPADFVFVNRGEVFTLDPQRMSWMQDFRMAYALYEGLVRWDNADFTVEPAAADLPEISQDRLTYTFHIRPDAKWSNGDPVTAHDFLYSWKRALLPDSAADYTMMFFCIEGGEAFFKWRTEQTAALSIDPWVGGIAPPIANALHRFIGRMQRIIDSPDMLGRIGRAMVDAEDPVSRELQRLRAAIDTDSPRLPQVLGEMRATRQLFDQLKSPTHRRHEVEWMWEETDRRFTETVGLRAIDDRTLEVKLLRPTAYFLDLVAFGVFYPVHRPTVEGWEVDDHLRDAIGERGWHAVQPPPFSARRWVTLNPVTGRFEQKHHWTKPGVLISNGPYVLTRWRYRREMRLERNPHYHSPQRVRSDSVATVSIEDANTAVLSFESGEIDWLSDVSTDYQADMLQQRERYEERYRAKIDAALAQGHTIDEALASLPPPQAGERRDLHVFPTFGTDFYSFNCRPTLADGADNPLHAPAVRRAFVLSVDRRAIVERVTRLNEPVVTTFVPPDSIPGYTSPEGLGYDPGRARRELADAGWSDRDGDGLIENDEGDPFPVVDLLFSTNTPRYKNISLALRDMWQRELGVRIELRGKDNKAFKEDLRSGNFMIGRGRWYGDYGDPTTFLDVCKTGDGNNDRGYSNQYVDDLLARAADETDPAARMDLLSECERYLFQEDPPMIVLCNLVQLYMYEPGRVKGLSRHPRLAQYLWQIEVDQGR